MKRNVRSKSKIEEVFFSSLCYNGFVVIAMLETPRNYLNSQVMINKLDDEYLFTERLEEICLQKSVPSR